jgi:hypothetical protein
MNQMKQRQSEEQWRGAIALVLLEEASTGFEHVKRFIANHINSGFAQTQRMSRLIFSNYWLAKGVIDVAKKYHLPVQPRDLTGINIASKCVENLANYNALTGRRTLLPHQDLSTKSHQPKRQYMPTQTNQISAAPAGSLMTSRAMQQHVARHQDPARKSTPAVNTSSPAAQHVAIDPNHARYHRCRRCHLDSPHYWSS